ncbi:tetratricopeptide repeat protein [Succinimonas sp.]|uniref:tetratricopeptide repeat protein n=1 Tax=Succinimonas sp. TaxID=1936151 RepID=UPI003866D509
MQIKPLLFLTAVICFIVLKIACTADDEHFQCYRLYDSKKYSEALPMCEKSCNLNNGIACFILGFMYEFGKGVAQDYQQTKTYYDKACNLDFDEGCSMLGILYETGKGVGQNFQMAKEYYGKACDLKGHVNQSDCKRYTELKEKGY